MPIGPSTTYGITMPRAVPRAHNQCRNVKARWKSFLYLYPRRKHSLLLDQKQHSSSTRLNHHNSKTIFIPPIDIHSYKDPSFRVNSKASASIPSTKLLSQHQINPPSTLPSRNQRTSNQHPSCVAQESPHICFAAAFKNIKTSVALLARPAPK